jgi:hypothetical protein
LKTNGMNPPASAAEIAMAERQVGVTLPDDLRAFYLATNGYNGDIGKRYVRLHPLTDLVSCTTGYDVAREFELVLIGDNGGDYGFALDRASEPPAYVGLPLAAARRDEVMVLGTSFEAFLAALGPAD